MRVYEAQRRNTAIVCQGPGCQAAVNFSGYRRSDAVYCSNACKQRAYRQRHVKEWR